MVRKRRPTKPISAAAMAAIRELGRQGGQARARNLSAKERSRQARTAARARWKKKTQ